jgi:CBS domain-containing protein
MRVKQLMSNHVGTCGEDADLAAAAKVMWDCDCGIVPIIDTERHLIGVITDRDICIAAATRSMSPTTIRVRDVMSRDVTTCNQDDDVRAALMSFKDRRVRRLPVVDHEGRVVGVISMNDLVARAECRLGAEVPGEQYLDTMKAISAHTTAVG